MTKNGQPLIDHTAEHLREASAHAEARRFGDMSVQILALPDTVMVRACAGGVHKTWLTDSCGWEVVATETANPVIPLIDGVLFRLERQCQLVRPTESGHSAE